MARALIKSQVKVLIKLFQKFVSTGKKPGHAEGVAFRKAKRAEGFGAEPQGLKKQEPVGTLSNKFPF